MAWDAKQAGSARSFAIDSLRARKSFRSHTQVLLIPRHLRDFL